MHWFVIICKNSNAIFPLPLQHGQNSRQKICNVTVIMIILDRGRFGINHISRRWQRKCPPQTLRQDDFAKAATSNTAPCILSQNILCTVTLLDGWAPPNYQLCTNTVLCWVNCQNVQWLMQGKYEKLILLLTYHWRSWTTYKKGTHWTIRKRSCYFGSC